MLRIPPTTDPVQGEADGAAAAATRQTANLTRRTAIGGLFAVAGCASGPYTNTEYARPAGARQTPGAAQAGQGWGAAQPPMNAHSPGASAQMAAPGGDAARPGAGLASANGYRLGPNDRVRITVFGEDRLSGEFALDGEGFVSLPLIGVLRARGATTDELGEAVREALAGRFILNPRVAVEVTSYRPFFILGEVNEPGEYPFSAGLTVLGAVALAKGFTVRADEGVAEISRAGAARALRTRITPSTIVNPGDVITIPQRWF